MRRRQRAGIDQLAQSRALDPLDHAQVAEEVDVDRREVQCERRHGSLQLVQLVGRYLVPLDNNSPQPMGVHGARGQPRRLQYHLHLLALDRLVGLEEAYRSAAAHHFLEFHTGLLPSESRKLLRHRSPACQPLKEDAERVFSRL